MMDQLFEYGFDIDKIQREDNEKYEKSQKSKYLNHSKSKKIKDIPISSNVPKVPKDISFHLKNRKPIEWVVDSFGAIGACLILAGDKGSGKTSFLYRLAEAVSSGEKFMMELETIKKKVLVWQADESTNNALNKLHRMDIKSGFDIVFKEDGWEQLNIKKLREHVEVNKYEVVLIDSISTLLANRGINFKDMEVATPLYELNDLASELNILIIINSHLNKEDRDEVNLNDLLGSGQISSAVSDIWAINKARIPQFDDHFIVRCLGKRNCDDSILWNLQGSYEDLSWQIKTVGDDDLLPSKKVEYRLRILRLLNENQRGLHLKEISLKLGCSLKTAQRCTTQLLSQNEICRKKGSSNGGRPYYLYFPLLLGH